jgi:hypothetical protein
MKKLLRQALPPVEDNVGPRRDLWPAMLRRLAANSAAPASPGSASFNWAWLNESWLNESWFDGALLAALVGLAAFFPASIPVLLYYL